MRLVSKISNTYQFSNFVCDCVTLNAIICMHFNYFANRSVFKSQCGTFNIIYLYNLIVIKAANYFNQHNLRVLERINWNKIHNTHHRCFKIVVSKVVPMKK